MREAAAHDRTDTDEIPPPPPSVRESEAPTRESSVPTDFLAQFEAAVNRLEGVIRENDQTVKSAISTLRTLVLGHYHRTTRRLDDHAKRLRVLEKHCGIARSEPEDK